MIEPNLVFDRVQGAIQRVLEPRQYQLLDQHTWPEAFGSRDATFTGSQGLVRLMWDGKDQCFVLERGEDPGEDNWEELAFQFFDPKAADFDWVTEIVDEFRAAAETFAKGG